MHRSNKPFADTRKAFTQISLKHHQRLDISGDWWPQAELIDRSLPAYTPAPSNPSFMGAFVPVKREWLPLFGRGFELRCFQLLSTTAWLPGDCLIRQPVN